MSRPRFLSRTAEQRLDRPALPWLVFACPLGPGGGWPAVLALLDQLPAGRPPETVILDLAGSEALGDDECAALCWLRERLAADRSRLLLAAPPPLAALLGERDLARTLGAECIHPSRRAAMLTAFAALPGPGLVTSQVKSALTEPPLPLGPAPEPPAAPSPGRALADRRKPRRPAGRLIPLSFGR